MWVCPNNGDYCQFKHCLPPGFILKSKQDKSDDTSDEWTNEDEIEKQRKQLDLSKCHVLTLELLDKWRVEHKQWLAEQANKSDNKTNKSSTNKLQHDSKSSKQMSGRALFAFNPNVFIDDEDADDEDYQIDTNAEWSDNEELQEFKAGESVGQVTQAIHADLFLDDELPDDDGNDTEENKHAT